MTYTLNVTDTLTINGQKVIPLPDEEIIHFEQPDEWQMVIVDNQLVQNKAIVFKNGYVVATMDFDKGAEFLKLYPKNKLVDIEKFEIHKEEEE